MDPLSRFNSAQHSSVHSSVHASVSQEKYNEYAAGHDQIAKNIAALMVGGHPIDSTEVQHWIGRHYEFVCQFWIPNRIAYKSLALNYTLDPAFKATYEAYETGLALFIQKAINLWADQNLPSESPASSSQSGAQI